MENNESMNNQVNESNNVEQEKKNNSKTIGIVVLVIGLLLVCFAGYKLFIEKPEPTKPKDDNTQEQGGNNKVTSEQIYKTSDGKYTFKLSDNGKAFINDKEITIDSKEENNKYIEIQGDFNPSPNYIAGLGFVLDKDTKLIVESPYYDENDKASDCGFDSYGEYARFCTRCYGFNVLTISNWNFFEISSEIGSSDIYTTSWKKLGSADVDNIKYDEKGIYVCNAPFESTCENGETQYDVNGNVINN